MLHQYTLPTLFISLGLAIIVSLSILYLRTASQNVNLARLVNLARTYRLGNTLALMPFQTTAMANPQDMSSYGDNGLLYEPINIKEKVFWPLVVCIGTIFVVSYIILISYHREYYSGANMILGGAFLKAEDPSNVGTYQLGTLKVLMFSFLASYVWGLWQLFRRMIDRDVTVYAFHVITIRVVTSAILAIMLYQLIRETKVDFGTNGLVLVAFAIGFFPEVVLRYLSQQALKPFRTGDSDSYLDIEDIEGIDSFARARLAEAGVFDVALLATSNPITLAVRTPYSLPLLVDWVGQAQLLLLLKDAAFKDLRKRGVRTSVQFRERCASNTTSLSAAGNGGGQTGFQPPLTQEVVQGAVAALASDPSFVRLDELVAKMCCLVAGAADAATTTLAGSET